MIALVAGISRNNCIGKDGSLPWHIPEDLKHFKRITIGNTVIMGRKTWESIPEKFRPLPDRKNIVITRQTDYQLPAHVESAPSLDGAIAQSSGDLFIIGGGQIYSQAMNKADTLYITHIDQHVDGDTFFPEIDTSVWKGVQRDDHDGFSFVTYKK